jgi:Coenzyme PQQ synthesis protein D (PqqD)
MTRLRQAGGVGIVGDDGTVYAARLPDGPIVVLDGIAGLIWSEACAGDRESIADRVAEATDASPDTIRADVEAFVADLLARGLLE